MDESGWTDTEVRKSALMSLVPLVHQLASTHLQESRLAAELRRLGHRMNVLASHGTPESLTLFFGLVS